MMFGHTLARLRTAQGISQSELGRRAGFDRSYISRLEADQRRPSWDTVETLAVTLDATLLELDELRMAGGFMPKERDIAAFAEFPEDVRRRLLVVGQLMMEIRR